MEKSKIYNIFNILIFILIVISTMIYMHNCILQNDDFYRAIIYQNNIKDFFKDCIINADQGRYVATIYQKLTVHGWSLLRHIHPNDNIYFAQMIKGINFAVIFYFISKIFNISTKDKTVHPIIYLSITLFSLYLFCFDIFKVINIYTQHFVYFFDLIFFIIPILIFSDYFINEKPIDNNFIIKGSISLFLLCISGIFNITTFFGFSSVLLLYFAITQKNNLLNELKNKKIMFLIFSSLFGFCLLFFNPNFQKFFLQRSYVKNNIIEQFVSNFIDFSKEWIYYVFIQTPNNILILAILFTSIYLIYDIKKNQNNKNIKSLIISLGLVFGAALSNYLLIFCGKTYYDNVSYWLVHRDLQLLTNFYFLISFLIISSCIYKNIQKTSITKIFLAISAMFFLQVIPNYVDNYYTLENDRILLYEVEKSTFYCALKGYDYYIIPKNNPIPDYATKLGLYNSYFYRMYGYEIPTKYVVVSLNLDFLRIMAKGRLYFKPYEFKKQNFTNLLNKDFVLNENK